MNETLRWISRHLDNYHFNSPRARQLKRKIEFWSALPRAEQAEDEGALLGEFKRLFCNNPYLEQYHLTLSPELVEEGVEGLLPPGDITGACADAYFEYSKTYHFTVYPENSIWKDENCRVLDDELQRQVLEQEQEVAGDRLDHYGEILMASNQALTKKYSYILAESVNGGASPGMVSVVLSALYLLLTLWGIVSVFLMQPWRRGTLGWIEIVIVVGMVLLAVLQFRPILNTIVKGVYRKLYRRKFNAYIKKADAFSASLLKSGLADWFSWYSQQVTAARARFARDPNSVLQADPSRAALSGEGTKFSGVIAGNCEKPWSGYSTGGERRTKLLPLMVILMIAVIVI